MNRFCTACGKALDPDAVFCAACGKQVNREDLQTGDNNAASPPAEETASTESSAIGGEVKPARVKPFGPLGSPPREPVDEPPESVFASTAGEDERDTIAAGADPAFFDGGDENTSDLRKYWIGGGVILLLLLGGLYYWLFLADDMQRSEGGKPLPVTAGDNKDSAEEVQTFYATSTANIRDNPTTDDSEILGKLGRGDEARGMLINSEDGDGEWLKLEDDKGYVFMANLSGNEMPQLAEEFGRKRVTLADPAKLLAGPSESAEILDSLSKGLTITLSGITDNDYAEVILRKGGVGYIKGGAEIVKKGDAPKGPAIAIKLDNNGCPSGSALDALYKQLADKRKAELDAIENADYPDDAARQAAINRYYEKIEGSSAFMKLQRSFEGLQVSGIAYHYEAQSLYFADPPAKVRETFRRLGYTVGNDGTLASANISAGIFANTGDSASYGKTDLQCGV